LAIERLRADRLDGVREFLFSEQGVRFLLDGYERPGRRPPRFECVEGRHVVTETLPRQQTSVPHGLLGGDKRSRLNDLRRWCIV
jgi:hypothetical protein